MKIPRYGMKKQKALKKRNVEVQSISKKLLQCQRRMSVKATRHEEGIQVKDKNWWNLWTRNVRSISGKKQDDEN